MGTPWEAPGRALRAAANGGGEVEVGGGDGDLTLFGRRSGTNRASRRHTGVVDDPSVASERSYPLKLPSASTPASSSGTIAGMATLHLRNVPDELDALLTQDAAARGVSKNRRAVELLRRGLGVDQVERAALVAAIRRDRREVDVDIAALIRDGRPDDA